MKEEKDKLEERLQEILDQKESGNPLDELVEKSGKGDNEMEYIRETDALLRRMDTQSPSSSFTANVMIHLEEEPVAKTVRKQGLIILLGVVLVLMITAFYLNAINPSLVSMPADINLVGQEVNLEGVGQMLDLGFIIKGLMFVTFFLAMMIFDRTVLRPFFEKRIAGR